jgi:hypothetical protein
MRPKLINDPFSQGITAHALKSREFPIGKGFFSLQELIFSGLTA